MRKSTLAVVIVVVFVGLVAAKQVAKQRAAATTSGGANAVYAGPAPPGSLGRTGSLVAKGGTPAEQALAQAKADRKPVVLSFRSNSCIPCVAMGKVVAELKPKYGDRCAFIDVSLDEDSPDLKLIEQHQIRVKPTTILLTKDGNLADSHIGVWPASELSKRLDELASR